MLARYKDKPDYRCSVRGCRKVAKVLEPTQLCGDHIGENVDLPEPKKREFNLSNHPLDSEIVQYIGDYKMGKYWKVSEDGREMVRSGAIQKDDGLAGRKVGRSLTRGNRWNFQS